MDFGTALGLLKGGHRVSRAGWNGKGMWLALSPGVAALSAEELWSPAARAALAGKTVTVRPYLIMKTVEGEIVPWLASQTDLLADDWWLCP